MLLAQTVKQRQWWPESVGQEHRGARAPKEAGKEVESYVVSIQLSHGYHAPEEQLRAVLDLFLERHWDILGFSCAKSRREADAAITLVAHRNDERDRCP